MVCARVPLSPTSHRTAKAEMQTMYTRMLETLEELTAFLSA